MTTQSFNPILPNYEYIPDVEPRVFDGRVYLYGSHDQFDGKSFCMNDYVCYSSPVNNLKEWRYEGVIYRRNQDPKHGYGILNKMAAPDVIKGNDGKYYLYYFIGLHSRIGVAVSDTPAGQYTFLGYVSYKDGVRLGKKGEPLQFDPGIFIDDDSAIYLYTGFGPKFIPFNQYGPTKKGAMVMTLENDMLTIKEPFKYIVPSMHQAEESEFAEHPFFEASSMRKINGKYYFIYSSYAGHELCYAISDSPDKDFKFGGVLISNGDIGLSDKAHNYTGNNHGSILALNGTYYVTYHRHTNRHPFSRQVCVEPLEYDGTHFKQAELTSMGFNGELLKNEGRYSTSICCHLTSKKGTFFYRKPYKQRTLWHPYLTQSGIDRNNHPDQYIAHIKDGTNVGFKYFEPGSMHVKIEVNGHAKGQMIISTDIDGNDQLGVISIDAKTSKKWFETTLKKTTNKHALYFQYRGSGSINFYTFELSA